MATAPDPAPAIAELDAAMCRDPARFREQVAQPFRPVVIRGLFADWPMVRAGRESPAAFVRHIGDFATRAPAQAFIGDPRIEGRYYYAEDLNGFNFQREEMELPAALARILQSAASPGSPSLYVGSLPAEIYLPGLADRNPAPMMPRGVHPRLWVGTASYVSCHHDTYDNLAVVVAGRRRFTLYPPEAIAGLYVGPIDNTMAGPPVALADGSAPGDPLYPAFELWRDRALEVDLQPGDALYLPKLWWHRVEATAPFNGLVNYWWDNFAAGPDAPHTAMLLAMIAIAERPAPERAAWRAFFDHYVFRPNGHPLAHLPVERHGILGSLGGTYGRVRSQVMRMLRGD